MNLPPVLRVMHLRRVSAQTLVLYVRCVALMPDKSCAEARVCSSSSAKQYLPFFQRAGRVTGICEHVLSGHRVKVHVPKEGVTVAFSPSGVRAPQRGQLASRDGRAATEVRWL